MSPAGAGSGGGRPKAVRPWRLALYLCGLAAIILALLSPLDTFAPWLFTLHMVEHQFLTMVARRSCSWRTPSQWSSGRSRETLGMPWVVSWHAGRCASIAIIRTNA